MKGQKMRKFKFKNKGKFGGKPRRTTFEPAYSDFRSTGKENSAAPKDSDIDLGISVVTLKDMPKGTYAIKQSPYDELNEASTPYPFVTRFNQNVSASYAGYDNLDGGKTSQYLSSNMSRLLEAIDVLNLKVGVNYRFLNLDGRFETIENRGTRILRLMYDAIVEAMAQLDATSFMELELVKTYAVGSTIPIDELEPLKTVKIGTEQNYYNVYFYNDPAAVILLASIEYQTILQQTIANFNSYNKFMTYNKKMLQMNYMREVPVLNDLFGQLKKTGFVTKLDSIALSIQGEWVDVDWAQQNNITANQVSRKSDAIIDPVLELSTTYNTIRDIVIYSDRYNNKTSAATLEPMYADFDTMVAALPGENPLAPRTTTIWKTSSRNVQLKVSSDTSVAWQTKTYTELSKIINSYMSIEDTLKWSRSLTSGTSVVTTSATGRFNKITWALDAVNEILSRLKIQFGDLRTIFEKLSPLGIINYSKGIKLMRTAVYDADFKHYLTVESIYKTIFTGVNKLRFDAKLGRWQSVALWDKFYGIPLYDAKNGGAFLTFCSKQIELPVDSTETANVNLIPAVFTYGLNGQEDGIVGVDRKGNEYTFDIYTVTTPNSDTARLAILPSQDDYQLRFPKVVKFNGNTSLSAMTNINKSFAKLCMLNALNCFCASGNQTEIGADIIAFYEYQLVDIAQPMLSYSKAYGPIKGTNEKPGYIGFAGLTGTAR